MLSLCRHTLSVATLPSAYPPCLAWAGSCEPLDESCKAKWFSLELAAERQKAHSGAVRSVHFSSDGKRIVTSSDDKSIAVWDAGISRAARPSHTPFVKPLPSLSLVESWMPAERRCLYLAATLQLIANKSDAHKDMIW